MTFEDSHAIIHVIEWLFTYMNATISGAGEFASVKSAVRTLRILEAFGTSRRPMSLGEIARAIDAPRSSCLALLNTLIGRGYLWRVSAGPSYYPSRRWLDIAQVVAENDPVAVHVRAALQRLRDRSGETAIFAMLSHDRSVYLDVVEATELVRFTARPGETKPLHISASGRAQLGVLDDEARRSIVDRLPAGETGLNRAGRKKLLALVAEERLRGWSTNRGEYRSDVISVAAGFDLHGTAHALVVAAPFHRAQERIDRIGRLVREEVRELVARLG